MASRLGAGRKNWACRALLALALSAPLAQAEEPPSTEAADAVLKAERYAAQAFEAYRQARHAEALALYQLAYESAPSADALYNIARIYDVGLGDRQRAIAAYERCLLEPGASQERLERAGQRLVQLRQAEAQQDLPSQSWPGDTRVPTPPAPAPPRAEPQERWPWLRGASVITGAAGVVSVGAGLGFGVAAISDANRANAACSGNRCRTQRGVDAAKSASQRATLATVGIGAGAGLLATSLTLWLLGAAERDEGEGELTGDVRFTPVASARELALAVEGRW